ncbi:MAG: hypothetical protein AB1410_07850 [Acidobacteriota bacterium]
MNERIKIGIFSPNDPRPWVRKENIDLMIKHESLLINALRNEGIEVLRGGEGYPEQDQIAWNTKLVREHAKKLANFKPDALIINEGSWTFPYDSRDAIQTFMNQIKGDDKGIARVIIFSYKDTKVPGMVAGMAVGGALKRIGISYQLVYGKIDKEKKALNDLIDIIKFYKKRADSSRTVIKAIEMLKRQKYLALGGMSLKMCTTTADVDQWAKAFGISYESLDQSELKRRALMMVKWEGIPGESRPEKIKDLRLKKAFDFLFKRKTGNFDFSRDKLKNENKFLYQLSYYYSALDVINEYNVTFLGIKCQDELSAFDCTQCITTAFLSNDVGPNGKKKKIFPTACENDMDSALTQLILYLLNGGKPAGFGDFRDLENGILAIVNCGQHPPYFFGKLEENPIKKLKNIEYMGQEIFYDAGGSSVRGRTPGGITMTVARLGRENLRYQLVAAPIKTLDVKKEDHEKYNFSWPIILGKIPIQDELMVNVWPCNHLGFSFGDYTPHLVEFAERVGIGYRVFSSTGREYSRPS